jgi:hypothetical protein
LNPIFIIPIASISFIAFYFLSSIFISDDKNSVPDETEEENTELPLPDVISAKVVKKRVGGECTGVKIPKYNAFFWITFLTDDGKELTFNVSQELFDKTNEGDVASLVTINDTFLDFSNGEDVEEENESI